MVENKYLVNIKISSQYFVIYPLLAMTEVCQVRGPELKCRPELQYN